MHEQLSDIHAIARQATQKEGATEVKHLSDMLGRALSRTARLWRRWRMARLGGRAPRQVRKKGAFSKTKCNTFAVRCRDGEKLQTFDYLGVRRRHDHARRPVLHSIHCQTPLSFGQHDWPRNQTHRGHWRLQCQPGTSAMLDTPDNASEPAETTRRQHLA